MRSFWRKIGAVIWKDVRAEFRTKEMLSAMLIFAFLVVVVSSFAYDPSRAEAAQIFPGLLWIAFFFAGILGLNRSFVSEKTGDALSGLMLVPADRSFIYFGKVVANWLFMTFMEAATFPVFVVIYGVDMPAAPWRLALVIVLATFGFTAVGTFLAALAANTRASEILLPLILFPIVVPVVIAAVETTRGLFVGQSLASMANWLKILSVYDVIFLVVPFLLFDYLLEV